MKHTYLPAKDRVPWKNVLLFMVCICSFFAPIFSQNHYTSLGDNTPAKLRLNEISPTAFRHFRNNFQSISNEVWYKDNNCFMASFTEGAVKNTVYYNSAGDFKYDIKSYKPQFLNKELGHAIHEQFAGYSINSVTEINNEEKLVYIIKILDRHNIKTLKCIDGNIIVVEDFINAGI